MAWIKKQWARLRAFEKRNRVRGPDGDPDFQEKPGHSFRDWV